MEPSYKSKPIRCYAWKITKYENIPEWAKNYVFWESDERCYLFLDADKGFQSAEPGDYIVKTMENFIYAISKEEFLKRYEICEES